MPRVALLHWKSAEAAPYTEALAAAGAPRLHAAPYLNEFAVRVPKATAVHARLLERGIIAAYSGSVDGRGLLPHAADRAALLEVDEAVLARLLPRLQPRVALFLNLFRDQLDRYGEVDSVAEGWARALAAVAEPPVLVLDADDPAIAQLADVAPPGPVVEVL